MQTQCLENDAVQMIQVLDILVQDVTRGVDVRSHLLTQLQYVLRVAGEFVKDVGECCSSGVTARENCQRQ